MNVNKHAGVDTRLIHFWTFKNANKGLVTTNCHFNVSNALSQVESKSRATRICETENLEGEEDHLRTTFLRNGYPEGFITSAMKLRTRQEVQQTLTEASNPEGRP